MNASVNCLYKHLHKKFVLDGKIHENPLIKKKMMGEGGVLLIVFKFMHKATSYCNVNPQNNQMM